MVSSPVSLVRIVINASKRAYKKLVVADLPDMRSIGDGFHSAVKVFLILVGL